MLKNKFRVRSRKGRISLKKSGKKESILDINKTIESLKYLLNNRILTGHFGINRTIVENKILSLEKTRDAFQHVRTRNNRERDLMLSSILLRLLVLGINEQAQRVDFIMYVFKRCDLDGYWSEKDPDAQKNKMYELNSDPSLRNVIRQMDKNIIDSIA